MDATHDVVFKDGCPSSRFTPQHAHALRDPRFTPPGRLGELALRGWAFLPAALVGAYLGCFVVARASAEHRALDRAVSYRIGPRLPASLRWVEHGSSRRPRRRESVPRERSLIPVRPKHLSLPSLSSDRRPDRRADTTAHAQYHQRGGEFLQCQPTQGPFVGLNPGTWIRQVVCRTSVPAPVPRTEIGNCLFRDGELPHGRVALPSEARTSGETPPRARSDGSPPVEPAQNVPMPSSPVRDQRRLGTPHHRPNRSRPPHPRA